MNKLKFIFLLVGSFSFAQVTLIPDPSFESYLVFLGIDTDGVINGQVLTSDIEDETSLVLKETSITDLTGIEDFTSLENLYIRSASINEIDLSQNLQLRSIFFEGVPLVNLDIFKNVNLISFFFGYNSYVTTINFSNNLLLSEVYITDSSVNEINLSNNLEVDYLVISNNNNLTQVNIKNSNNLGLDWFQLRDNPNLQCLQVDDPAAVMAGTDSPYDDWVIENNPVITEDCFLGIRDYLATQITIYPNPAKDNITVTTTNKVKIKNIQLYDFQGRTVMTPNDFSILNISSLQQGIYLLYITTDKGVLTQKIVKEAH